jgi:molybdopterin-guanine dinucleotide biosynthesis protein A
VDAIVLAGGAASRLGGIDKGALVVGGRTLLQRALAATARAASTIVVGPRHLTERQVRWTREEPPGGGPVAALAAGLELTSSEIVAVLAVDLPQIEAADVAALEIAAGGRDGAIFVDDHGRDQPLAGVYRADALRSALDRLGSPAGASMRAVVARLDLARLVNDRAAQDCDTPEDLEAARSLVEGR